MEDILETTYTQEQLDENYGDDLFAHDALTQTFMYSNPDAEVISSVGGSIDNGDGTLTYTITITYEE